MSYKIESVIYYIEYKKLCIKELKKSYNFIPALITVIFNHNDRIMTITDLHSRKPGKEYATHLIIYACHEAKKRGISNIILDDCSDNYRKTNNIYTKIGMKYFDNEGGPEMNGIVEDICIYKTSTKSPIIYSLII